MDPRSVPRPSRPDSMLESIVARAVDPGAVDVLMDQFAIEKTLSAPGMASRVQEARVRIHAVAGTRYIFCPVPPFHDEARNVEAGFAIDVDQDHFDVYPYMFNQANGETLILSRLPHCVVRAIKVDAGSYDAVDDRLKEVANESSAILFISNLYTELSVGLDSPVEFFDNRLFQQLIGKVLSLKEGKWVNHRIVSLRFNQLLHQLDRLDEGSSSYNDSKRRVIAHLAHFLFETTRVIRIEDLLRDVDEAALHSIMVPVIAHQLANRDLAIALETIKNACGVMPRAVLEPVFSLLVASGHFDHAMVLEQVSGQSFGKDAAIARDAFAIALQDGAIDRIEAMAGFLGVPFNAGAGEVRRAMNSLVASGHVTTAMQLEQLSGTSCKPDDDVVRGAFPMLLSSGAVGEAITLEEWTGITCHAITDDVVAIASTLLVKGNVVAVEALLRWMDVDWRPVREDVQDITGALVRHGQVDAAMAVEAFSNVPWVVREIDVQAGYKAILPDIKAILTNLAVAKRLASWTKVPPAGELVHEFYATILHAAIDDDRRIDVLKDVMAWSGIVPLNSVIFSEFKSALKPGQFKGANVTLVRRLSEITGIPVPLALVSEVFSTLLSPPLRSYSIDDAAQLSAHTGERPGLDLVQAAYRCIMERQVVDLKEEPVVMAARLQSWTGVAPIESIARAGQDLALLRGDIVLAKAIGEWAGVRPQVSLVQDAIAILLAHPDPGGAWYAQLEEIISWTSIRPGSDMVQSAFITILLSRWLTPEGIDAARSLARLTHVKPGSEIIGKIKEKLAREVQLGYERVDISRSLEFWVDQIARNE